LDGKGNPILIHLPRYSGNVNDINPDKTFKFGCVISKSNFTNNDFTNTDNDFTNKKVSNELIEYLKSRPWWSDTFEKLQVFLQDLVPKIKTHVVPHESKMACLIAKIILKPKNVSDEFSHFKLQKTFIDNVKTQVKQIPSEHKKRNHALILTNNLLKLKKIDFCFHGFALSPDGLWRYHAWGYCSETKQIIETSDMRTYYVGIPINLKKSTVTIFD